MLSVSLSAFADAFSTPSTNLNFSNITSSSITLNWTAGGGQTRIVIARKGSLAAVTTSAPQYNTTYTANSNFNLGADLASGKVVYYGSGSSVNVTGLEASSAYYFTIIEVDVTDLILYYASNEVDTWKLDGNASTVSASAAAPTVGASSLNFTSVTTNSLTLNWTNGNGTNRIVVARKGSAPSSNPNNYEYYSGNSAFGSGNALGNGFVVYNGTGNSVNVTGLEEASTYYFNVIEYNQIDEEIILYANSLKTTGNTTTSSSEPTSGDSDEDGVSDEDDEYPQDAYKAFNTQYPAAGYGTIMFEDLWPGKGDYDFNDLVLNYRYNVVSNAAGNVVEVKYTFVTRAIGGALHNGFAFQLDGIPANRVHSVSGTKTNGITYATFNANGTEANQTFANIIVFKDAFDLLPFTSGSAFINVEMQASNVGTDTTEVTVKFLENGVSPVEEFTSISDFTHIKFNPYIIVEKNRGHEIHLANRVPSSLMNTEFFGKDEDRSIPSQGIYYRTENGLPWALDITESIPYATEKTDFTEAFLKFGAWAASNGTAYTDWYLDLTDYRDSSKIYTK